MMIKGLLCRWRRTRADLRKHAVLGLVIAFVSSQFSAIAVAWNWDGSSGGLFIAGVFGSVIGACVAWCAGWIKEDLWDKSGRGTVDKRDLVYTRTGGLVGAALFFLAWTGHLILTGNL